MNQPAHAGEMINSELCDIFEHPLKTKLYSSCDFVSAEKNKVII